MTGHSCDNLRMRHVRYLYPCMPARRNDARTAKRPYGALPVASDTPIVARRKPITRRMFTRMCIAPLLER